MVIADALKRVQSFEAVPFAGNWGSVEQKEAEICDRELKAIYCFLLGDYSNILKKSRQDNTYLGWSSNIKGIIVPLLLLYLKRDEERKTCAERRLIEHIKYRIQLCRRMIKRNVFSG